MITLTAKFSGVVGAFKQTDYYTFTLNSTETVTFDLAAAYGQPYLNIYDYGNNQYNSGSFSDGTGNATTVNTLGPGTYLVEISDSSTAPYTLSMYYGSPTVGDGTAPAGGPTLGTAKALGQLSATTQTVAGYVGGGDPADYFSFTVGALSLVNLQLSGLQNPATIDLLDAAGNEITYFSASGTSMVDGNVILPTLAAGTYYLEVLPSSTYYPTGYSLSVKATTIPQTAGGSIATALSMGSLGTTAKSYTGEVNQNNAINYYSFSVASASLVSVLLSGVTANAQVELYDAAGNSLPSANASASPSSNGSVLYDLPTLSVGTYYIGVQNSGDATNYTVTAMATPIAFAGSNPATATSITLSTTRASVSANIADLSNNYPSNYYKFTLSAAATVNFRLTAGSADVLTAAQMTLTNAAGNSLVNAETTSYQDGLITDNLAAGTYYIQVSDSYYTTPFTLTYWTGAPTVGTSSRAGSAIAAADNAGTLTSALLSIPDYVNSTATNYYEFTLSSASTVRIDVTGMTQAISLNLYNAADSFLTSASTSDPTTGASLVDQLAAGTYYVSVNNNDNLGTGFNIGMSASALPGTSNVSLATADNIGTLGVTTQSVSGYVGGLNQQNYVEFNVTTASTINAMLSGSDGPTGSYFYLLDISGDQLASTYANTTSNGSLTYDVAPGTYFLEVYNNNSTDYNVTVNANPIIDAAGSTLATATSINNTIQLSGSASQYDIANNAGALYLQDSVANRDGTQTLPGISVMQFADGVGVFDPTGTAEQVARLYGATFKRAADLSGLEYWVNQVNSGGISLAAAANGFTGSTEFQNDYGALSNDAFINLVYENVLGRAADQGGLTYWEQQMANGASRGTVVLGFAESEEYIVDKISFAGDANYGEAYRLYQAALDRTPDATGLQYWTTQLAAGLSASQAAQDFINSAEFQTNYGNLTAADFVTTMYENVLHRAPDPAGAQYWVSQMQNGLSQASVLLGFSDSLENRINTAAATHDGWVFIPG